MIYMILFRSDFIFWVDIKQLIDYNSSIYLFNITAEERGKFILFPEIEDIPASSIFPSKQTIVQFPSGIEIS